MSSSIASTRASSFSFRINFGGSRSAFFRSLSPDNSENGDRTHTPFSETSSRSSGVKRPFSSVFTNDGDRPQPAKRPNLMEAFPERYESEILSRRADDVDQTDIHFKDLISKSAERLDRLLNCNQKRIREVERSIQVYDTYGEDMFILASMERLLSDRINQLQAAIAFRISQDARSVPQTGYAKSRGQAPTSWTNSVERGSNFSGQTFGQYVPQNFHTGTEVEYDELLTRVFKIDSFRPDQLEVITKTMEGHDTFVLMPTGGGKSLCYQLPAVFQSERSNGTSVTVVVSPLVALIHDQVNSLVARGVDAVGLTQGSDPNFVERRLRSDSKPALLYVTPEKIEKSSDLHKVLCSLYRGGNLALFAIDEAHCIPTWGSDFRKAYQELHTLRVDFPGVPIMALTATATRQNIEDIISQLKLENAKVFRQSLNRPNIEYVVKPKRNDIHDVVKLIQRDHEHESGIIYRTGRSYCKALANILRKRGIPARHYHAGLRPADKLSVYNDWNSGKCRIIVATVSFGLGIDKRDVRFVIHYDLPKSLENYYQETGRAGRDGQPARCILYYNFRDLKKILDLTPTRSKEASPLEPLIDHRQNAWDVVHYCEDQFSCRRVRLLEHFGEIFDKKDCSGCSNCSSAGSIVSLDLSTEARLAIFLVQSFAYEEITLSQCIAVFRGANTENTRQNGRNFKGLYGAGKRISQDLTDLLFNELLYRGLLEEYKVTRRQGHHHHYLQLGPQANTFLSKYETLELKFNPRTIQSGRITEASILLNPPSFIVQRVEGMLSNSVALHVHESSPEPKLEPKESEFDFEDWTVREMTPVHYDEPNEWGFEDLTRVDYENKLGHHPREILRAPGSTNVFRRFTAAPI